MNLMEPKKPAEPTKDRKLKYNPADLFNPYKYESESELDPVVPDIEKPTTKLKKSKNEY